MTFCIAKDPTDPFRGEYETTEAAIAAAPDYLGLKPGDVFYVGEAHPVGLPEIDGYDVLDQARTDLRSECGEAADEALACTAEQEEDLGAMVTAAMAAWMVKHRVTIGCRSVDNETKHVVPAAAASVS